MSLFKKRVFNPAPGKYWGADAIVQHTQSDGTVVNLDQTTGAYQEPDGTWYSEAGDPLSYYDPSNGNYVEENDSSNTVYSADGTPIGTLVGGQIVTQANPNAANSGGSGGTVTAGSAPASSGSSSSWLTSLLNTVSKATGNSSPSPSSTLSPTYKPTVSTSNTSGLIVSVLVIGAVVTGVILIVRHKRHAK